MTIFVLTQTTVRGKTCYLLSRKSLLKGCVGHASLSNGKGSFKPNILPPQANVPSDTLAEFHLPKSGIENIVHQMQFPHCQQKNTQEGLLFLSLCSIRSLLNRIHNAIYAVSESVRAAQHHRDMGILATTPSPSSIPISNMEGVIKELLRQLESWYLSLPEEIKPVLDTKTSCGRVQQWLRSRYWSARHIITRPCLVDLVTSTDETPPSEFVLANSQICIESCQNFIRNAADIVQKPSQYTWMMIQAWVLKLVI